MSAAIWRILPLVMVKAITAKTHLSVETNAPAAH
jgi:hypothetical protein